MDLNEVRYIIAGFTDKLDAPEEFDARLNLAHHQQFAAKWRERDFESLRPFKVSMGGETPPLYLTNGSQYAYCLLPTDYHGTESATSFYNGEQRLIEFLEDNDFNYRKKNKIEIPTLEYPIGNLHATKVKFLPKTLRYVNFDYIRKPEVVKFGYTISKGFIEYDPTTSVELPWDNANLVDIILMVLQEMGVGATREQVEKQVRK